MKLITILFLFTLSFFSANAQELEIANNINIEVSSVQNLNEVELSFTVDKNTIVKKKSYKYIIENTLSGRNNLIFKRKRSIKTC